MAFEILSRGITLDQLQVFSRVIETGSLMAAARGDKSLQTSYSRRIKRLEEAVEKKLFSRKGRTLQLTEAGRVLAVMTNSFFASLDEFAFGGTAKVIRIGAGESVLETFVYPAFKALRVAFPEFSFDFIGLSTVETTEALTTGQIEFGMLRDDADLSNCETLPVGEMEFELVVPRSLLPQGEISALGQLRELPVATLAGHGRFATSLERLSHKEALNIRIVASADSFSKVAQLSTSGQVASFLPREFASQFPTQDFSRHRSSEFDILSRSIVLAVSKDAVSLRPALHRIFNQVPRILSGT